MKDTIEIDISKDTLDAHRLIKNESRQFANSPAGLRALRRWIGAETPDLVIYEATGAYHAAIERSFAGFLPLVKVNPLQARRFAQARGTRAKTDAVDARVLAMMGSALDLVPDAPTDKTACPERVADRPHGADQGTHAFAEPLENTVPGRAQTPVQGPA